MMITYKLNKKIESGSRILKSDAAIEIVTEDEYSNIAPSIPQGKLLNQYIENIRYCKAETLHDCIIGTFLIPDRNVQGGANIQFGYYINNSRIIFIDNSGVIKEWIDTILQTQFFEQDYVFYFFFVFLEFIIRDDIILLQDYENELTGLEDELNGPVIKGFESRLHIYRKKLMKLHFYYSQLSDLAESLSDNDTGIFSDKECRMFKLFYDRVSRLHDNTHSLREYSLQLHEMYQSKIDLRLNETMRFMTVITTIFTPLMLIAGWYGMNFINMPELHSPSGYIIVIGVSIAILATEIIYLKYKKWFK